MECLLKEICFCSGVEGRDACGSAFSVRHTRPLTANCLEHFYHQQIIQGFLHSEACKLHTSRLIERPAQEGCKTQGSELGLNRFRKRVTDETPGTTRDSKWQNVGLAAHEMILSDDRLDWTLVKYVAYYQTVSYLPLSKLCSNLSLPVPKSCCVPSCATHLFSVAVLKNQNTFGLVKEWVDIWKIPVKMPLKILCYVLEKKRRISALPGNNTSYRKFLPACCYFWLEQTGANTLSYKW